MITFYDALITGAAILYFALVILALVLLWRASLGLTLTLLWALTIIAVPELGLLGFYVFIIFRALKGRRYPKIRAN